MLDEFEKEADNVVQYKQLFDSVDVEQRKTKVMCSLGPSSWDQDMQAKLIEQGMNLVRIDMSLGDHKEQFKMIDNNRMALLQQAGKSCGILCDLTGPEILTNPIGTGKALTLSKGQQLQMYGDPEKACDDQVLSTSYSGLTKVVEVGQMILIDNAQLKLEVTEVSEDVDYIMVEVKNDYKLQGQKNIRIPGSTIDIPCLSEKDENDIMNFALKHEVDFIAPSFIRKGADVDAIREVLTQSGSAMKIISKINSHEALQNYDEILASSDGVMIVRSELGMEIPLEKVYVAQKWMLEKANIASKCAIIATQTLESMIKSPRPTRAEALDIGNAISDGADCICLGDEVGKGDYPVNALSHLAKICVETEKTMNHKKVYADLLMYTPTPVSNAEAMAQTVCQTLLERNDVTLIVNTTSTGKIPRLLSKYRPAIKVLSAAPDNILRQMAPLRGVQVFSHPDLNSENAIKYMIEEGKVMKLCKIGEKVAIVTSSNDDMENEQNDFQIVVVN